MKFVGKASNSGAGAVGGGEEQNKEIHLSGPVSLAIEC